MRRGRDQVKARLPGDPRPGLLATVRRAVVNDDVEVLVGIGGEQVSEEADKGGTGIPPDGLAADLPALHLQGREQRGRPVAGVLVTQAFDLMRFRGQPGVGAVQGLDRGCFIHREDHRILGRVQVQAHHGQHLRVKLRVGGSLPVAHPMRLQGFGGQHRVDQGRADSQVPGQRAHAPVRAHPRGRRGAGRRGNAVADHRVMDAFPPPAGCVGQAGQPGLGKAPAPFDHHGFRDAEARLDLIIAVAVGGQEDNPGAHGVPLGGGGSPHAGFQRGSFCGVQGNRRGMPSHEPEHT